jgi:anti-anti-sigma regulatory factor
LLRATGDTVLELRGPLRRGNAPAACEQLRALVRDTAAPLVVCDVSAVTTADVETLDALARVALAARRVDARIRFRGASVALEELIDLAGFRGCLEASGATPAGAAGGRRAGTSGRCPGRT